MRWQGDGHTSRIYIWPKHEYTQGCPTPARHHHWGGKKAGGDLVGTSQNWGGGWINIRVTLPYSNLLMKGQKFGANRRRRRQPTAFCGEGNLADRSGRRLSFQHRSRPDSAAVGVSLNMINAGTRLENVFRALGSPASEPSEPTHKTNVSTRVTVKSFHANKLDDFFLFFTVFACSLLTLLYLNLHDPSRCGNRMNMDF